MMHADATCTMPPMDVPTVNALAVTMGEGSIICLSKDTWFKTLSLVDVHCLAQHAYQSLPALITLWTTIANGWC